jgi:protein TonB
MPTGAVPDAPQSADHAVDPAAPTSPAKADRTGGETATEPAKPVADEPKVETPPAELKPAPKPEPSQIAKSEPETMPAPAVVAPTPAQSPMPGPEPGQVAKVSPDETLDPVKPPSVSDAKPVEEAKVETLPDEYERTPQPPPTEAATSEVSDAKSEPAETRVAPRTEVKRAAVEAKSPSPKPEPQPIVKAAPAEEKAAPKSTPAQKPKETAAAGTQGGLFGKPMSLGFGRAAKQPVAKVSSGRYAANVRAAIGRHRPKVGGGGSATVAFSIGPGGGLQGVKIVRSSGKPAADQAAIATVRAAAPFPPPPVGVNPTFSIQIYFR